VLWIRSGSAWLCTVFIEPTGMGSAFRLWIQVRMWKNIRIWNISLKPVTVHFCWSQLARSDLEPSKVATCFTTLRTIDFTIFYFLLIALWSNHSYVFRYTRQSPWSRPEREEAWEVVWQLPSGNSGHAGSVVRSKVKKSEVRCSDMHIQWCPSGPFCRFRDVFEFSDKYR